MGHGEVEPLDFLAGCPTGPQPFLVATLSVKWEPLDYNEGPRLQWEPLDYSEGP